MTFSRFLGLCGAVALVLGLGSCDGENPPARWSYIYPAIIQPNCATASCHSAAAAVANVDLSDIHVAYRSLVSGPMPGDPINPEWDCQASPALCAAGFVRPGRPAWSKLMYQLTGTEAGRMPPQAPLPNADIYLIGDWIAAGAEKN